MTPHPPTHFGAYKLRRKLADGGMGQLFLAQREMADGLVMECVVKTIRPSLAPDPRYAEMFLREARISACLRHQNIVQIFDCGRDEAGTLFLVMEYVAGRNLQEIFDRTFAMGQRLSAVEALRLAVEILKGLEHAHDRCDENGTPLGIVHRDLTPNNILISNAGEVKIADFGIAKVAFGDTTERHDLRGKFHYMAPEQIEGRNIDARADLFLVGIVLYEALTGVKPFEADSIRTLLGRITRGEYRDATELVDLPERLGGFLRRALQRDAAVRFQSAREMLAAAERILLDIGSGTSSVTRDVYVRLFGATDAAEVGEPYKDGPIETRTVHHKPTPVFTRRWWVAGVVIAAAIVGLSLMAWWPPGAPDLVPEEAPTVADVPVAPTTEPPTTPATEPPATAKHSSTVAAAVPVSADPGRVIIGDLMPYARVYVDGAYYDDTPTGAISLQPGVHEIKLVNPNLKKTSTVQVKIEPGKTRPIYIWP
ncbi:MAG: serine/threonine-protein kinase [Candidatus Lernaella stagnicola]|nr:serine/threonine-protein kinase [Candidatus Lernaella stagnicola]